MFRCEVKTENIHICENREYFIGSNIDSNIVSFLNFSVYENNIDDLTTLLEEAKYQNEIKYPHPIYTIIKKCIFLARDKTLNTKNKLLKITTINNVIDNCSVINNYG